MKQNNFQEACLQNLLQLIERPSNGVFLSLGSACKRLCSYDQILQMKDLNSLKAIRQKHLLGCNCIPFKTFWQTLVHNNLFFSGGGPQLYLSNLKIKNILLFRVDFRTIGDPTTLHCVKAYFPIFPISSSFILKIITTIAFNEISSTV